MTEVSTGVVRPANAIDDAILRYAASNSPEEIAQMLGGIITPERVASRAQELLKTRNWLTLAQQQQRLFLTLSSLLAKLQEQYMSLDAAKVMLAMIKELFAQTKSMGSATEEDLNKLYGNQGLIMARVVDKALSYMKGAFRDEIDPEKWEKVYLEALEYARDEIALYEAGEIEA